MADVKTKPTRASVKKFLASIANERRRTDCETVVELMQEITGERPQMWGTSIIGFGRYRYEYESGRSGEWMLTAVSPRKQSLTVHIMSGFDRYEALMAKLGKHTTGKSCLYINSLDDVHLPTLKRLITRSVTDMRKRYPVD